MSRHTRMERMVSSRVGDNVFQGCVINPVTGRDSAGRPRSAASSVSMIDVLSDEGIINEKGSSEDDMDVVGGVPSFLNNPLTEEILIRPESRRLDIGISMEQSGKKVQEWVDKSFSRVELANRQIAQGQPKGQLFHSPYITDKSKHKVDSNYSRDDPFKVHKYLPNKSRTEEAEKPSSDDFQETYREKKDVKGNFAEVRKIMSAINSIDNKKITEEIEQKQEQKRRAVKGKKMLKLNKDRKKSKGKTNENKSIINTTNDDNDEVVGGPRVQRHDFAGKPILADREENHRYKSLLGELNSFMKSHKNAMVGKTQTLNLEPVNINMEEFEEWLDSVDSGLYNKNEVSERYQIKEEIYPGVFELPKDEKPVTNTGKVKKKKRSPKKATERKNNSEDKITPEYTDQPYLKQAWDCKEEETKTQNSYAFEVPIEVLDEEVLNSWRSTPYFHKEREEKVIRVLPDKKRHSEDMSNVLLDVE